MPTGAPYGAAEVLSFSSVLLNEARTNPIACIGESAVHKAVNLGDVNSTSGLPSIGGVNSADAGLIARVVAKLDSGFAADPLTDPLILADLTGDGTLSGIDATDASQIQTRGPASQPQVPEPVITTSSSIGLDPTVQTGLGHGQMIFAAPGTYVTPTLQITDDANGLTSGDLVLHYDPSLLTMATDSFNDALGISLNSQLAGWGLTTYVPTPGTINVGFFETGGSPLTGPVDMLSMLFSVPADAGYGSSSTLGVETARNSGLNGGSLVMSTDLGAIGIATQDPKVTGVYVSSTRFSPAYLQYLAASGLGSSELGYQMPSGDNQLRTLSWSNLNQISVQFSQDVNVTQSALTIAGVSPSGYGIAGFVYDPATRVATWTLSNFLSRDKLIFGLNSSLITDAAGHQLDGDWTNGTSAFSGDGTSGGNFTYRVNLLPGDADSSGTVDLTDLTMLANNWQKSTPRADLDGSGFVDLTDLTILANNWQVKIASMPEPQLPDSWASSPVDAGAPAVMASSPVDAGAPVVMSAASLPTTSIIDTAGTAAAPSLVMAANSTLAVTPIATNAIETSGTLPVLASIKSVSNISLLSAARRHPAHRFALPHGKALHLQSAQMKAKLLNDSTAEIL